jgi:Flp pilus assembly protein CpaB
MNRKVIVVALVAAAVVTAGVVLRSTSRADAAAGNCYADAAGPAEPTVCN